MPENDSVLLFLSHTIVPSALELILILIGVDRTEREVLCRGLAFGQDVEKGGLSEGAEETDGQ